MVARQHAILLSIFAAALLSGCSPVVGLYHDAEGGAIAKHRQPPPGANLPYPNLADVPSAPGSAVATVQANQTAVASHGVSAASSAALAGLTLPTAPPPLPEVPGLSLSSGMTSPPPPVVLKPVPVLAKPVAKRLGPPISIAFRPGSALLPYTQQLLLGKMLAKRGAAHVRVCGFGDGSMTLALARARRLADELTADGVPGYKIELDAFAEGSGGFVQLVY